MSQVLAHINIRPSRSVTEAEALCRRLTELGGAAWLVALDDERPQLVLDHPTQPIPPAPLGMVKLLRKRFETDPRFQRDLFGWLYVEGRVLQRYAEHQPRIVLDDMGDAS